MEYNSVYQTTGTLLQLVIGRTLLLARMLGLLVRKNFFEIIINVTINDASWDVEFLTACPGAGALK